MAASAFSLASIRHIIHICTLSSFLQINFRHSNMGLCERNHLKWFTSLRDHQNKSSELWDAVILEILNGFWFAFLTLIVNYFSSFRLLNGAYLLQLKNSCLCVRTLKACSKTLFFALILATVDQRTSSYTSNGSLS